MWTEQYRLAKWEGMKWVQGKGEGRVCYYSMAKKGEVGGYLSVTRKVVLLH